MISGDTVRHRDRGAGKANEPADFYDGLNLSLEHGTGIATYTRTLARMARELGYEIGAVYSSPYKPSEIPLLQEISFFDPNNAGRISRRRGTYNYLWDQIHYLAGGQPERCSI